MKRDMRTWINELLESDVKKAIPILSFPSIQLLDITVRKLISDSDMQAKGMKAVADRTPRAGAAVSLMDLSVEAECFGAPIRITEDEVPTVLSPVIDIDGDEEEHLQQAREMVVPKVGSGRTQVYIDAISKAVNLISDRPVFAGVIGPFSLAGRLLDVSSALTYCLTEPEMVHIILNKVTEFIIEYAKAFKEAGANGVIIAEPLAGLLSPKLAMDFSGKYCKKIIDAIKDDSFVILYHNCGNTAKVTLDSILACGADIYHFGNVVDMEEIIKNIPVNIICMGNIDPAREFRIGNPESIRHVTMDVMNKCGGYKNFIISSGCDIPPMTTWENIDAFFETVDDYYKK